VRLSFSMKFCQRSNFLSVFESTSKKRYQSAPQTRGGTCGSRGSGCAQTGLCRPGGMKRRPARGCNGCDGIVCRGAPRRRGFLSAPDSLMPATQTLPFSGRARDGHDLGKIGDRRKLLQKRLQQSQAVGAPSFVFDHHHYFIEKCIHRRPNPRDLL
jgi:hypothetical protein